MSRTLSGRPLSGPPSLLAEAGPAPARHVGARQCRPAHWQPACDGATSAWRGDWGVRAALHLSVTLQRHTGSAAEAQWTLSRVKWRLPIRRLSKLSHRRADFGATRDRRAAAPPATDLPAGSHARGPGNARGHCKRDRDQRTVSTRTRTQQRPRRRSLSWLRD
jgi:hypothetical protein